MKGNENGEGNGQAIHRIDLNFDLDDYGMEFFVEDQAEEKLEGEQLKDVRDPEVD